MADSAPGSVSNLENGDEIDLRELVGHLWRGRWIVLACALVGLILASFYLKMATYRYTGQLVVAPVAASGGSRLSGLGGLAAMAGINLPQDTEAQSFALFTKGLHSRELADRMARHPEIMQRVFAAEWDAANRTWVQPGSRMGAITGGVKTLLGIPSYPWRKPDGVRLQEYMARNLKVHEGAKDPFLTLALDHRDPVFATHFLNVAYKELDDLLRRKSLARTSNNIQYLSNQLEQVTLIEHRNAIVQALGEQERKRMAASSSAPYAAEPLGQATASTRPTSPQPVMVLAMAILLAGLIGSILALLIGYRRQKRVEV